MCSRVVVQDTLLLGGGMSHRDLCNSGWQLTKKLEWRGESLLVKFFSWLQCGFCGAVLSIYSKLEEWKEYQIAAVQQVVIFKIHGKFILRRRIRTISLQVTPWFSLAPRVLCYRFCWSCRRSHYKNLPAACILIIFRSFTNCLNVFQVILFNPRIMSHKVVLGRRGKVEVERSMSSPASAHWLHWVDLEYTFWANIKPHEFATKWIIKCRIWADYPLVSLVSEIT